MAGKQGKHYKAGSKQKVNTKPRKKGGSTIDWESLKLEWVTTNISITDLAKKYKQTYKAVHNHYLKQNWKQVREDFEALLEQEYDSALRDKAREIAGRVKDLDQVVLNASEKIVKFVDSKLDELQQKKRPNEARFREMMKVLKIASEALKNSHYNIRLASDRATEIIESTKRIALTPEEEARIEREFSLIKEKRVPEDSTSKTVVSH